MLRVHAPGVDLELILILYPVRIVCDSISAGFGVVISYRMEKQPRSVGGTRVPAMMRVHGDFILQNKHNRRKFERILTKRAPQTNIL